MTTPLGLVAVLSPSGPELVLWLHVLAACIWIGGQVTVALLVPLLRGQPAVLSAAGRRYQVVAWIAFFALILTGLVNAHNAGISLSHLNANQASRTLSLKLVFVLLSGLAAAIHAFVVAPRASRRPTSTTRALSAILGIVALLAAAIAALYGVVIAQA